MQPWFLFSEAALLAQGALALDGIGGFLYQGVFGGAALLMLWKYIQQVGENERKREENAQTFLAAITAGLKENTNATHELSAEFREFAARLIRDEPRGKRPSP